VPALPSVDPGPYNAQKAGTRPGNAAAQATLTYDESAKRPLRPDLNVDPNAKVSPPIRNPIQGSFSYITHRNPEVGQGDGRFAAHRGGGKDGDRPHKGIDIAAPLGTPVHPVGEGKVIFSGEDEKDPNAGYKVKVQHKDGSVSIYMHLNGARLPKKGDRVTTNVVIGEVGNTGNAPKGPGAQSHLHLQLYGPDGKTLLVPNIISDDLADVLGPLSPDLADEARTRLDEKVRKMRLNLP